MRTSTKPPVTIAAGLDLWELGLAEPPTECKMNVLGTRWTVCGAPADEPCYCDVMVTTDDDTPTDAPGDDCPDHGPYGDDECPKCSCGAEATLFVLDGPALCYDCACPTTFAVTLQSLAIDAVYRRNRGAA